MKISQFFFTKFLFKKIESIYFSKAPSVFIQNQLQVYYFWWGYQNLIRRQAHIISTTTFQKKKNIYLYQL